MVTRCLEALDRLDELSQQIYKKSSLQGKICEVESRLKKLAKVDQSKKDTRERRSSNMKSNKSKAFHRNIPRKTTEESASETRLPVRSKVRLTSRQEPNIYAHTRKEQLKRQTSKRILNSKQPNEQHNPVTVTVHRNETKNELHGELHVAQGRSPEPLCWEEQVNSKQVKILERTRPPIVNNQINKTDSHPVIFHDKKWIKEMLEKRPARLHLASCRFSLPQVKEEKTNINNYHKRTAKRASIEHSTSIKSIKNDELELKGRRLPAQRTHLRQFIPQDRLNKAANNSSYSIGEEVPVISWINHQGLQSGQKKDMYARSMILESAHATENLCITSDTSLHNLTDAKATLHSSNQYDISVCVPNANCAEGPADDCRSLVSCATDQTKHLDIDHEISPNIFAGDEVKCLTKCSDQDMTFVSHGRPDSITVGESNEEYWNEIKASHTAKKNIHSHPSPELPTYKNQPGKRPQSQRSSSRLVYTPSSPPLFLADDVIELPRGISPTKALMELRQNFCENIRKETKQLEFDLQELYLKKQLHNR